MAKKIEMLPKRGNLAPYPKPPIAQVIAIIKYDPKRPYRYIGTTAGTFPEYRNEIILGKKDKVVGKLAARLYKTLNDTRILDLCEKPTGRYFLVYNENGKFVREFKNYFEATEFYNPQNQVVIFTGENNYVDQPGKIRRMR